MSERLDYLDYSGLYITAHDKALGQRNARIEIVRILGELVDKPESIIDSDMLQNMLDKFSFAYNFWAFGENRKNSSSRDADLRERGALELIRIAGAHISQKDTDVGNLISELGEVIIRGQVLEDDSILDKDFGFPADGEVDDSRALHLKNVFFYLGRHAIDQDQWHEEVMVDSFAVDPNSLKKFGCDSETFTDWLLNYPLMPREP